ncbi:MAG TPA: hypothetical protein VGV37_06340 [Aliidongia sp.]|uniref:hypothetical protein n=1 Tax=Aliidongia sp. TaxID=1914230 RepID=UPI002DDD5EBD|nr:hypothetical protein [Aliidongia sp.]HEV2674144.1 hypothetical protein [Aliidongia sp.]
MFLDGQLQFVTLAGQSLVGAAGVAIPSNGVIDLLGEGVGMPPANIIGNASTFGEDPGVGIGSAAPIIQCSVGTAFATGNAATLNVALQLAADTGAAGNYQPSTWTTIEETGPLAVSLLTANQIIARLNWSPTLPGLRPRYARLLFQVPSGTNFTAGSIAFAGVVIARDDQANKQAAKNYTV